MKTYKINFSRTKLGLAKYIVGAMIGFFILILFKDWFFSSSGWIAFIAWVLCMETFIIYPFLLLRDYYIYDKKTVVKIDEINKIIIYCRRNKYLEIPFSEIERLYIVRYPGRGNQFYYYKFILKNHSPIFISCLVLKRNIKLNVKIKIIGKYNLFLKNI